LPVIRPQSGNFAEAVVNVAGSRLQKARAPVSRKEKIDRAESDKREHSEHAEQAQPENLRASFTG
jgi:hypothetical protein